MNASGKLALYALVLGAMVAGGAVVGSVAGPISLGDDDDGHSVDRNDEMVGMDMGGSGESELPAGGLLVAQDGYRFVPAVRTIAAGASSAFAFTIAGPDGDPVRDYKLLHDRELHLVLVSRDLAIYSHLHPSRDAAGVWSVTLPALGPGPYRFFADFQPADANQLTLGVDITVPGTFEPAVPPPAKETTVGGFDVRLTGDPADGEVTVTVRWGGEVVTTDPYLGAAGHLVAIRDGDLAYLHVHPIDAVPAGPVRFGIEVPSEGTYGLFFDFQVDGTVYTAPFLITTSPIESSKTSDATATTVAGSIDHGSHG